VLQSVPTDAAHPPPFASPAACFYVLRDHPVLLGTQVTDPHVGRASDGSPDVEFGFTRAGARTFQRLTAGLARRGAAFSGLGVTLDQHFAVALDDRLLTVPLIDFRSYPQGLSGSKGADIVAGFTPSSARDFAILLRFGPLPVSLQPR
jgi:SecD/SecF fusion protein